MAHSACQAPSARSSTWSAAARWRVAASCGVVRAARRTRTESTGLRLVRHRRRAAADRLAELADLGPAQHQHVAGDPAARVGGRDERVAGRVTGRRVRVPGRGVRPAPSRSASVVAAPRSSTCRPDPPHLHRERASPRGRRGLEHAGPPRATLTPNVIGSAGWVRVRPTMAVSRCSAASAASALGLRPEVVDHGRRRRPAQQQHQRGVEHVLAGQPLVQRHVGDGAVRGAPRGAG